MNDTEIHELLITDWGDQNVYLFNFNPKDEIGYIYNLQFRICLFFSLVQKLKDIFNPNNINYIGDNKKTEIINYKCKYHNLPYKLYCEDLSSFNVGRMFCEECHYMICKYDYVYYFDDYKFGLHFKINKILNNIKNAEITINQKLYPLYLKYVDKLEGNRKKRFKRNYYRIHKKMKFLKNFINDCITGFNTNKFGFIYCLYYFPEITINKYNLTNNINEDIYIQKLSSYFYTNKWITLKRKVISEDDYKNNNKYFIVTDKKIDIHTPKISKGIMYYLDENYSKKILDNENIKYIDEENGNIYYFEYYIDNEDIEQLILIILTKKNKFTNECEIIYKKYFCYIKCNDEENNCSFYILGERCDIKYFNHPKINTILIKKIDNNIYFITKIFICILNANLKTQKIILITQKKDLFPSLIEKVINVKKYLFIFRKGPKNTNVIDLKTNELIIK